MQLVTTKTWSCIFNHFNQRIFSHNHWTIIDLGKDYNVVHPHSLLARSIDFVYVMSKENSMESKFQVQQAQHLSVMSWVKKILWKTSRVTRVRLLMQHCLQRCCCETRNQRNDIHWTPSYTKYNGSYLLDWFVWRIVIGYHYDFTNILSSYGTKKLNLLLQQNKLVKNWLKHKPFLLWSHMSMIYAYACAVACDIVHSLM